MDSANETEADRVDLQLYRALSNAEYQRDKTKGKISKEWGEIVLHLRRARQSARLMMSKKRQIETT